MAVFDTILDILGDPISIKTQLQLQRPQVRIVDPSKGNATVTTVTSDVPDLVVLTAVLPASSTVAEGATLSGRFRNGPPFPGEPALVWTLTCERAEVRLTAPGGSSLGVAAYLGGQPVIIEVHDFETEEVRNVEWKWDEEWQAELPVEARNIGQLYELFAEQDGGKGRVADFEAALKRHELLEAMLNDWDAQQKGASR